MALITLRGYFFNQEGEGVGGIEVNAYAKNSDGTWAGSPSASVTSASGSGKWEIINLDTANAPQTGLFSLQFRNTVTEQIRNQEGNQRAMFEMIYGPDGSAPIPNGSILAAHLGPGSATDTAVGNRTISDNSSHASDTGTVTQLLSRLGNMITRITGKSSWRTAPDISLATAYAHINNTSNPHNVTAGQIGAATASFATVKVGAVELVADGPDDTLNITAGTGITLGTTVGTDTLTISASGGSSTQDTFRTVIAGGTSLVADSATDTLTLAEGYGVDITGSSGSDTATFKADLQGDYKVYGTGDQSLTSSFASVASYTSRPAGTYYVWTTIRESYGSDGGSGQVKLVVGGSDVVPLSGYEIGGDFGTQIETFAWVVTLPTTGTIQVSARKLTGAISVLQESSVLGYVRIA